MDLLIKNLKILTYNSVVKDQDAADRAETVESANNADVLRACIENKVSLSLFEDIPEEFMYQVGLSERVINLYKKFDHEQEFIPKDDGLYVNYRRDLVNLLRPWFINNYVEKNEYYRMIAGLPPLDDWGIPMRDYEYLLPEGFTYNGEFLHEIGYENCRVLEREGILDIIKAEYPDAKYLDYITCGIDIYEARLKQDFQLLYVPDEDVNDVVRDKFMSKFMTRRRFVMKSLYNSVMREYSPYYHKVMIVFLLIMTLCDMVSDVHDHIIRKDILDRRCIQYLYAMYGVPYYRNIPFKYHERVCRNLFQLVTSKSSPTDVFNLLDIFNAKDVNIYKWYLMKVRKFDEWGDFKYSSNRALMCDKNTVVENETRTEKLSTVVPTQPVPSYMYYYSRIDGKESDTIKYDNTGNVKPSVTPTPPAGTDSPTVPAGWTQRNVIYPFDYFLEKGNVMIVRLDNTILEFNKDYVIYDYNKIRIKSSLLSGKTNITYDFYYDITTMNRPFFIDEDHSLNNYTWSFTGASQTVSLSGIPFPIIFKEKQEMLVVCDGEIVQKTNYTIDYDNQLLVFKNSYSIKDKQIRITVYFSRYLSSTYAKTTSYATTNNQTNFYVKEPFAYYVKNGHSFFITYKNKYVEKSRYTLHPSDTVDKSYISFTDGTKLPVNDSIEFHFIYSKSSEVNRIYVEESTEDIQAEYDYQVEIPIHPPVDNYVGCGYKLYVLYDGNWLDESIYTYTNHSLVFLDETKAPLTTTTLKIVYVYCKRDRTKKQFKNVGVVREFYVTDINRKKVFNLNFPVSNYNTKYNYIVVDFNGHYLDPSKYTIDYTAKTLTITKVEDRPPIKAKMNYTYIYNMDAEYVVDMPEQIVNCAGYTESTNIYLDYPFFPYLQTGNDFQVIMNGKVIDKDRIEMVDQVSFHIKGLTSSESTAAGHLIILYIFSSWYSAPENATSKLIVDYRDAPLTDSTGTWITVPEPAPSYLANGWPFFMTYNGGKTFLEESKYDIISSKFYTYPMRQFSSYPNIVFAFVYVLKEGQMWYEDVENLNDDLQLYFCRIPLDELYANKYMLNQSYWKAYEPVVASDGWWDGLHYKENAHNVIKNDILNTKWNYARTKYYGIYQDLDFNKWANGTSLFYSMLFDDVLLEKNLTVKVNTLSPAKEFNIAHLFLYMTCLTYAYNDMEDIILEYPSQIMAATGFNFKASLNNLKTYIRNRLYNPDDFPVFDMKIPTAQIADLVEFMDIYKTDVNVRDRICKRMMHAQDWDEYTIWKKMYDSLMTWQYNLDYFKLSDGSPAMTYSEYLKDQDIVLYTWYKKIRAIEDQDTKIDTIIDHIDAITYILDEFIDIDYIYEYFPGKSAQYAMSYLKLMIDFFKSYKVWILEQAQVIDLDDGGNSDDSRYSVYDHVKTRAKTRVIRYIPIKDDLTTKQKDIFHFNKHKNLSGNHWIREDVQINEIFGKEKKMWYKTS